MLPASEPASGSVRPNAASLRPEARSGSHSCFCSSVPKRKIGIVPSEVCAATVIATDESIRVSSSIASAYETVSPPAPPYSSGIGSPISPSSPSSATSSYGKARLAVELLGDGRDALARELAHGVADELLLLGEVEVHAPQNPTSGRFASPPIKEREPRWLRT